jgi:hypothetical protein
MPALCQRGHLELSELRVGMRIRILDLLHVRIRVHIRLRRVPPLRTGTPWPVTPDTRLWFFFLASTFSTSSGGLTEDGVLNEFEMMWQLRILFPLHFVVFKQTACHLTAEANVKQVFFRAKQLSEVNLDSDTKVTPSLTWYP